MFCNNKTEQPLKKMNLAFLFDLAKSFFYSNTVNPDSIIRMIPFVLLSNAEKPNINMPEFYLVCVSCFLALDVNLKIQLSLPSVKKLELLILHY